MDYLRSPSKFMVSPDIWPTSVAFEGVKIQLVVKTILLASSLYFVFSCVYSRYFHPLRHFPGPFWASVSNFWKLYICIRKDSHTRGIYYHNKYGE